jgi:L-arabinokinase
VPTIVYYVSGHGFGHARRTAQVLRTLASLRPDVDVIVRTSAPAWLFDGIERTTVSVPAQVFDPGVVERDTLNLDPAASVRRLGAFLQHRVEIVSAEYRLLRDAGASLVVADIPFLAADAAESAGLPSVAVGNFTWDWIYEPFVMPDTRWLIESIRASYGKVEALLQLPLGHEVAGFRRVIPVPLLASKARNARAATLARLGLDPQEFRPRVLIAMRGGLDERALRHAASRSPGALFLTPQPIDDPSLNLRPIDSRLVEFTDLLAACDAVVSKLGYGILSDCIANNVALLFPPRSGFREDEISRQVCPRYLRMRELPAADFVAGRWDLHLDALLGQPPPPEQLATDGDLVIARYLADHV